VTGSRSGGKNSSGGSHSFAGGRRGGGCGGTAAPLSSGAVKVAPETLGPARAGPFSSGGLARRWWTLVCAPAAERSRAPAPVRAVMMAGEGGGGGPGSGPSPQKVEPEPLTRLVGS
jgi:hypothetical protein